MSVPSNVKVFASLKFPFPYCNTKHMHVYGIVNVVDSLFAIMYGVPIIFPISLYNSVYCLGLSASDIL